MEKPLISIITPCYNNARLIHRLLDSVLEQTYPKVEMYVIDDGSSDDSKNVVEKYIPVFRSKGYDLYYFYQPNSGQSVAIRNGLKMIKGEYMTWPDSDDYYASPMALEKLYDAFIEGGDNIGMVRCEAYQVDEETLTVKGPFGKSSYKEDLFEACLLGKNVYYFLAGGYMVKVKDLFVHIPKGEIYTEKRAGQNWQLMLPMLYKQRCITVKEKLYHVVVRTNSHSRPVNESYDQRLDMLGVYERTICGTLDRMPELSDNKRNIYKDKVYDKYRVERFLLAIRHNRKEEAKSLYVELKQRRLSIGIKNWLWFRCFCLCKILKKLYLFAHDFNSHKK